MRSHCETNLSESVVPVPKDCRPEVPLWLVLLVWLCSISFRSRMILTIIIVIHVHHGTCNGAPLCFGREYPLLFTRYLISSCFNQNVSMSYLMLGTLSLAHRLLVYLPVSIFEVLNVDASHIFEPRPLKAGTAYAWCVKCPCKVHIGGFVIPHGPIHQWGLSITVLLQSGATTPSSPTQRGKFLDCIQIHCPRTHLCEFMNTAKGHACGWLMVSINMISHPAGPSGIEPLMRPWGLLLGLSGYSSPPLMWLIPTNLACQFRFPSFCN